MKGLPQAYLLLLLLALAIPSLEGQTPNEAFEELKTYFEAGILPLPAPLAQRFFELPNYSDQAVYTYRMFPLPTGTLFLYSTSSPLLSPSMQASHLADDGHHRATAVLYPLWEEAMAYPTLRLDSVLECKSASGTSEYWLVQQAGGITQLVGQEFPRAKAPLLGQTLITESQLHEWEPKDLRYHWAEWHYLSGQKIGHRSWQRHFRRKHGRVRSQDAPTLSHLNTAWIAQAYLQYYGQPIREAIKANMPEP